jgi:hypothetical protein
LGATTIIGLPILVAGGEVIVLGFEVESIVEVIDDVLEDNFTELHAGIISKLIAGMMIPNKIPYNFFFMG